MLKEADPDVIVDALRTVAGGGLVLGPRRLQVLGNLQRQPVALPAPFDRLTARERDILRYVAGGETNARIARRFGLSEKTVRNQLSAVFATLRVSGRV